MALASLSGGIASPMYRWESTQSLSIFWISSNSSLRWETCHPRSIGNRLLTSFAFTISWSHPLISNNYQEHVTVANRISNVLPKIDPQRNTIYVEEDRVWPKVFFQFVFQIFGEIATIVATV